MPNEVAEAQASYDAFAKTKKTLLICEDQGELISQFRKDFSDFFEIIECSDSSCLEIKLDELKEQGQFPDIVLLDLYWPRQHIDPAIAHDMVNNEVRKFNSYINELRDKVNCNLFPAGIEMLSNIRTKFSAFALPVLIYTRAGPYTLEPEQIQEIYNLESAMIIKSYRPDLVFHLVSKHIERWQLPWDVFISYSEKDSLLAEELFVKLSKKELNVFLAKERIEPGEEWSEALRRALRLSKVLLLLLTNNSRGRAWVNAEAGAAWSLGKKIISACRGIDIDDDVLSLVGEYQALKCDTEIDMEKIIEEIAEMCQRWRL